MPAFQPPARPAGLPELVTSDTTVCECTPATGRAAAASDAKHAHARCCAKPCKAAAAAAAEAEAEGAPPASSGARDAAAAPSAPPPWAPAPRCDGECAPAVGSLWALALCPSSGAVFAGGRGAAVRWQPPASPAAAQAAGEAADATTLLRRSPEGAYALELAPGGATLYAGCGDGAVRALCAASGAVTATFGEAEPDVDAAAGVYALALAPARGVLYAGAEDGTIRGWRVAGAGAGACAESLDGHDSAVTALVAAPAATSDADVALVSGCEGGALCGWRAGGDGAPVWRMDDAHTAGITALCWDAPSGVIFSASWDGAVRAVRAHDGAPLHFWPRLFASAAAPDEPAVPITALALGPSAALWAGADTGAIARVDAATGAISTLIAGAHGRRAVTALVASADGERLLSAGLDRTARAWTVAPPAAWAPGAHGRFPAPFRDALATLRLGCVDAGCALGATLGGLDADTRGGLLDLIAASLARQAYGAQP